MHPNFKFYSFIFLVVFLSKYGTMKFRVYSFRAKIGLPLVPSKKFCVKELFVVSYKLNCFAAIINIAAKVTRLGKFCKFLVPF